MADSADLLFELGTEELPPTALKRLMQSLEKGFLEGLDNAGLSHGACRAFATPRRLALLISDVQLAQEDRQVERRGPAVKAAFDADGNPTKAALGFAGSCGTTVDQLECIETDKGEWLQYRFEEQGKPAAELLPEIAMQALNGLPIPKRMRWGSSDAEFVRPVHWLLFLHGNEVVDCTLLDTAAGNQSYGHRFHAPGNITILHPTDYEPELRYRGKVIAGFEARRDAIREQVDVVGQVEAAAFLAAFDDNDAVSVRDTLFLQGTNRGERAEHGIPVVGAAAPAGLVAEGDHPVARLRPAGGCPLRSDVQLGRRGRRGDLPLYGGYHH